MGASKKYALFAQGEPDESDENLLSSQSSGSQRNWFGVVVLLMAALVMSLTINLVLTFQWMRVPNSEIGLSKYARLPRDVPTVRMRNYTYDSPDRAVEDASWDAPIVKPENGFIALDESFVEAMGLEHSMRWPWDTTKGVYILTSSHELHCVHVLRDTVNQAHDGLPVRWGHEHAIHCLNVLRESIMCNADDTPMYKTALNTGIGMVKMCRDWNKLQMWARERSACWKPYKTDDPSFPEIDRYKFCPDGSRPWEEFDGAQH